MKVVLKDGSELEIEQGLTCYDVAKKLSEGLARNAVCAKLDGVLVDLDTEIKKDSKLEIVTLKDKEGLLVLRHSTAHVLAEAVLELYPTSKIAIGPANEDGFFYEFDFQNNICEADLEKIELQMKKIIKADEKFTHKTVSKSTALKKMKEFKQPYKVELIESVPDGERITMYTQGNFVDFCRGPHIPRTGMIKAFKLTRIAGAYWKGDEKNKMLTRVYGTAFASNADMEAYFAMIEEARKRDHNKLGRELELFTTIDTIGQGLPILLPKGAKVIQLLQRFVEDYEQKHGWQLTKTPLMAKSDLYKLSGHWDHYKDGMFVMGDEEKDSEVFALRPMTCPFQYQCYLNKTRSYKDLPLRYDETSTLFRNEASGEMHGLIRVRQFTISEGHLMCTPEQLEQEFKSCVEMAVFMLKTLGLYEDASYRFSQWDPKNRAKYIGTDEQWNEAQGTMEKILNHLEIPYVVGVGEAAFYGPKLDIQIKNVWGKEDTLITIQIDQMLAEKFGMVYTDKDGTKKNPYIIHRTSIGCYERTLAYLIEKYAGAFPTWLAPVQVKVMNVSEKSEAFVEEVCEKLMNAGIRAEKDIRGEKIGYKIREAVSQKIPYLLVIGENEAKDKTVAVRKRGSQETVSMPLDEFIAKIQKETAEKTLD